MVITTRAYDGVAALVHHDDRREIAEEVLQTSRRSHFDLTDEEGVVSDFEAVLALVQHGLHERRRCQIGGIHDHTLRDRRGHGPPDGGVGLPHDYPSTRGEFLHQKCRLEASQVVVLGTDHRKCAREPRCPKAVRIARAAVDPRHVEGLHQPQVVVLPRISYHHHADSRRLQQLDDPHAESLQAAHDDVPEPVPGVDGLHNAVEATDLAGRSRTHG